METHEVNYTNDRRQTPRNRFGWVRRLMQGQNRTTTINSNSHSASTRTNSTRTPGITTTTRNNKLDQSGYARNSNDSQDQSNNTLSDESDSLNNDTIDENNTNDDGNSLDVVSDIHSDNVSTTPLKSIISTQSTKEPSILSGEVNNDINSLNASTAETSLAPSASTPINYTFAPTLNNNTTSSTLTTPTSNNTSTTTTTTNNNNNVNLNSLGVPDRDSESIVTLASSTRRIRRSIDTNCSTVGIPPASIMERLSVQPGNSNYANSIRTANDRTSQVEATSHYDDQDSSVTSF